MSSLKSVFDEQWNSAETPHLVLDCFTCICAVQRVWTQAKPTADFAWKKYLGVHNFVVVSTLHVSLLMCIIVTDSHSM